MVKEEQKKREGELEELKDEDEGEEGVKAKLHQVASE